MGIRSIRGGHIRNRKRMGIRSKHQHRLQHQQISFRSRHNRGGHMGIRSIISIGFSISRSLSVVGITVVGIWVSVVSMVGITEVMSISIVSIEGISISLWLSISRSLAIVVTVVGIWVSIVSMVGITKVGSITIVSVVGISISTWLSI